MITDFNLRWQSDMIKVPLTHVTLLHKCWRSNALTRMESVVSLIMGWVSVTVNRSTEWLSSEEQCGMLCSQLCFTMPAVKASSDRRAVFGHLQGMYSNTRARTHRLLLNLFSNFLVSFLCHNNKLQSQGSNKSLVLEHTHTRAVIIQLAVTPKKKLCVFDVRTPA